MVFPRCTEGKLRFLTAPRVAVHCQTGRCLLQTSQEYAGRLVSAHTDSCPWRDTVCDAKLGQFPKLPARDVYVDFEHRYAHLDKLSQLPPLTAQAVDKIKESVRYSAQSSVATSADYSFCHHEFRVDLWADSLRSQVLCRDDMAVVLKRQRLRLAGMQAQSRLPAQNMDLEPLQTLKDVSQGLAGG